MYKLRSKSISALRHEENCKKPAKALNRRKDSMEWLVFLGVVVLIAIVFLKGFDMIAGRGPKQVSDGIRRARARESEERIPCPMCAEKILPEAKICPFCKSELSRHDDLHKKS